jgi:hypothetical protein
VNGSGVVMAATGGSGSCSYGTYTVRGRLGSCQTKGRITGGRRQLAHQRGEIGGGAAPVRWRSSEGRVPVLASRVALRLGAALGPAHEGGGVVRWPGDG